MSTKVYGTAPIQDSAAGSVYWIDTAKDSPKDSLTQWHDDTNAGPWMYLRYGSQGNLQSSNGNLISLKDHDYAYDQRYSAVDWMSRMQDSDYYGSYGQSMQPDLAAFKRVSLLDMLPMQPMSSETQISAGNIVIADDQVKDKQ